MTARLNVRKVAEARGASITSLHFETRLALGTVRRYWYGTSDGREDGPRMAEIDLEKLGKIANALGVCTLDLLIED